MKNFWNQRYKAAEYAYGIHPNKELANYLKTLSPGKILFPGEGEGRNAVFAAKLGWEVEAFDSSEEGKVKALKLASLNKVKINYVTSTVEEFNSANRFDVIAMVYLHLPPPIRISFHKRIKDFLADNGIVYIQAFSKEQLGKISGGPQNEMMLYSLEVLKHEFDYLDIIEAKYHNIYLNEGPFHKGEASNITFIGKLK